jgi:hypothetical protein
MVFHRSIRCDQEISSEATDVGARPMACLRTRSMTLRAVLTLSGTHRTPAQLRPMDSIGASDVLEKGTVWV